MNMKGRSIGMILLAIYLILIGVVSIGFVLPQMGLLMGLLAAAAGVCILIGR
jgi:hypothetical protein